MLLAYAEVVLTSEAVVLAVGKKQNLLVAILIVGIVKTVIAMIYANVAYLFLAAKLSR